MPTLDLNSVILTSIGLAFMMVLVLSVVAAHQERGLIKHWIYGLLFIGLGLSAYFIPDLIGQHRHDSFFLINGFSAICLGISIYVNGIRMLKGYRIYRYLSLLVLTILLTCNATLLNLHAPVRWILVSNLLVMLWIFVYGTKSLMGHGNDYVNQVFWLCSSFFASITIMLTGLLIEVALIESEALQTFHHWNGHAYMVLLSMLVFCAVTALLVLVLQVRTQIGLQAIATLDSLTGVLNRRGLQDAANKMQAVSRRIKLHMALLIVDLDYFKKVNDVYGHLIGDVVLKSCANIIRSALRGGDVIGRYGGEEFCILLPNTSEQEAAALAERIRDTIEKAPINISHVESLHKNTRAIKCTVSIGSVSSETVGYGIDNLFAAADQHLYQAKQAGRNRISSNVSRLSALEASKQKRHARVIV